MTRSEFEQLCADVCPHCKAQPKTLRRRLDNGEWVHDFIAGSRSTFSHTICMATHLRNSEQAKNLTDG